MPDEALHFTLDRLICYCTAHLQRLFTTNIKQVSWLRWVRVDPLAIARAAPIRTGIDVVLTFYVLADRGWFLPITAMSGPGLSTTQVFGRKALHKGVQVTVIK